VRTSATLAVLPLGSAAGRARARAVLTEHSGRAEVAKPTHGSGSVLFLRAAPRRAAIEQFCATAARSFYDVSRETQYKGQERKVIIEADLSAGGVPPLDYKFFCAGGEVLFCQVDVGRFTDHRRALFTADFVPIDVRYAHDAPDAQPPRPAGFEAMVDAARALSCGFRFVRVDLYAARDAVYFGEFTFAPEGGAGPLSDEAFGISVMQRIRAAMARGEAPS